MFAVFFKKNRKRTENLILSNEHEKKKTKQSSQKESNIYILHVGAQVLLKSY